jgi:hypothetical protein
LCPTALERASRLIVPGRRNTTRHCRLHEPRTVQSNLYWIPIPS